MMPPALRRVRLVCVGAFVVARSKRLARMTDGMSLCPSMMMAFL